MYWYSCLLVSFLSPSPRSSHMERLASMSPAAQRLASSKLGIHIGTDKSLRLSYTPSPSHAKTSEGRTPTVASANTPPFKMSSSHPVPTKCLGTQRALNMNHSMESLTDDLLHLPKRSKAADFFSVS